MKALVLAGGKGTRLRPITHTSAKQLIPIANKPILFYGLEAIAQAGIQEVGIVVGETHREIEQAVGDGTLWNLRVTYIPQEAPLGLAHAAKIAEFYLKGQPFVMYLGDNLLRDGITRFVERFEKDQPAAQILLARVPHPEHFGVAELRNGKVVRLEEKPEKPSSDLALVGVYLFRDSVFEVIRTLQPSQRGELEITDAIQGLIDREHKVHAQVIEGWWKDTGKPDDILEANRLVLESLAGRIDGRVDPACRFEGRIQVGSGATVERSTLRGPVIIGPGCRIIDSYIGPFTSIGENVCIEESEIEHAVVMPHAEIRGVKRLEGCLIGQYAVISRSPQKPAAFRMLLGDSSRVEVP